MANNRHTSHAAFLYVTVLLATAMWMAGCQLPNVLPVGMPIGKDIPPPQLSNPAEAIVQPLPVAQAAQAWASALSSYCAATEMHEPGSNAVAKVAWTRTDHPAGFDQCFTAKVVAVPATLGVLGSAACLVGDTVYNDIVPVWLVSPRAEFVQSQALLADVGFDIGFAFSGVPMSEKIDRFLAQNTDGDREVLNGVPTRHYHGEGEDATQIDVWLADPAGYLVQYQIVDGDASYSMQLYNTDQPFQIEAPAPGRFPYLWCAGCDLPLPPNSQSVPCCGRPDGQVLAYVTQENSDAVLAYYKEQLPQEGWQIEEESQVKVDEVDKHRLIVARGDHRLQIDVWQDQIAVFLLSPSWNDMVAWGDWIDMSPYCPQPPDLAATGKD